MIPDDHFGSVFGRERFEGIFGVVDTAANSLKMLAVVESRFMASDNRSGLKSSGAKATCGLDPRPRHSKAVRKTDTYINRARICRGERHGGNAYFVPVLYIWITRAGKINCHWVRNTNHHHHGRGVPRRSCGRRHGVCSRRLWIDELRAEGPSQVSVCAATLDLKSDDGRDHA